MSSGQGRGRGRGFNPFYKRNQNSNQNNRQKPIFAVPQSSSTSNAADFLGGEFQPPERSFQEKLAPQPKDLIISCDSEPGAYYGWKLYFPLLAFRSSFAIRKKVEAFQKHITSNLDLYDIEVIKSKHRFEFNLGRLENFDQLLEDWPSFNNDIKFKSTEALACMGLAMHNVISEEDANIDIEDMNKKIFVRPIGYVVMSTFKVAKDTPNELMKITGTVTSLEKIRIQCKMMCFKCSECSANVIIKQVQKSPNLTYPSKCHQGCQARGNFRTLYSSPYTIFEAKQLIKVQQASFETDKSKNTIDVEMVQEFCESLTIGTNVSCTGVIKYKNDKAKSFQRTTSSTLILPYMKCFHIEKIENSNKNLTVLQREVTSRQELELLNSLKKEQSIFRILVNSMAPEIISRQEVKAGLILALLSGGSSMGNSRRSESHVLIVGNPGLGKSHLLKACAELSPIATFVNGPTCTGVSLTGKIDLGKKQQLTAGILVQSNDGICCIDEFDKMPKNHSDALLECMEQQTVTIAKCGAQGVVPAKVSIIAAANPALNFFTKDKTLMQNIHISKPILSRFDLIFTLINQPQRHQASLNKTSYSNYGGGPGTSSSFFSHSSNRFDHQDLNWLKLQPGENFQPLSMKQLQTFIQYAKKNVSPTLTFEAQVKISKKFLEMKEEREAMSRGEKFEVTFRQFEAMLRLCTARARADLRSEATEEDAIDVINLMEISTSEFLNDKPNVEDCNSPVPKRSKIAVSSTKLSIPKQIKMYNDHLLDKTEETNKTFFTHAELREFANEIGIDRDYINVIDRMNYDGVLLIEPGGYRYYKIR